MHVSPEIALREVYELMQQGRWQEAEHAATQLTEAAPHLAAAWACLGAVQLQNGQFEAAEALFRRCTLLAPSDAAHFHHLSIALLQLRRHDEAVRAARAAIEKDDTQLAYWLQLGRALFQSEQFVESASAFGRAVALDPLNIVAWNNLAGAEHAQNHWPAAQQAYESSLALDASQIDTKLKLANVFERQWSFAAAERLARDMLRDAPACADAWAVLGRARLAQSDHEQATRALAEAYKLQPTSDRHSRWLQTLQYAANVTPEILLAEHRTWNAAHGQTAPIRAAPSSARRHTRLKLGFVSADFGLHPTGHMVLPVLERLDKQCCHVTCYFDARVEDRLTPRFRAAADDWRSVHSLSNDQLAEQIAADEIDVLIDLMGHVGNRLPAFARRPAPMQVTWFGYVGTTGLSAMDYLLADGVHVRAGEEPYYVEKILRMPHGYACYGPPTDSPTVAPLPAKANGYVTFGCFNNPAKYTRPLLDAWAEILRRNPQARLLLKFGGLHESETQARLRGEFSARGIDGERLFFEGWSGHAECIEAYGRVDIALDTWPYSGGVTTCEALWMGVPVVTFPGRTFAGRHSASHLTAAGYSEWIATDMADYVAKASSLAACPRELSATRQAMRDRLLASPLLAADQFARDLLDLISDHLERA
jgi:predicted O-linked N-acetylglucosamine transferase (SPINDLY family)